MNKSLTIMITALLLLPALAFATGGGDSDGTDGSPYNILWYNIGTPQKDTEMVFETLSEYTAEKIGATVDMVLFDWGEYNDRMRVITASGEPYDIAFTSSWANHYGPNVERGAFLPLTDLLEEYGQGILEVVNPAFFQGITIDNEVYAVPANKELGWWEVWIFNSDIVEKYGLDTSTITNFEDLASMLEIVKNGESADFTPIMADRTFSVDVPEYAFLVDRDQPFVVDFEGGDPTVKNLYETPEMMETLRTLHRYYEAGYFRKDVATLNNTEELRKNHRWFVGKAHFQPFADLLFERDWGMNLEYASSYTPYADNFSTQGSMQAISVTSGSPERSMAFLNLMNTDPYVRNLVGFGVEDVHWQNVGENTIEKLHQGKDYQVPGFTLQNLFITHLFSDDPANKWEVFEEFNESCRPSPALGFQFDITPVKNELTALRNIHEEYKPFLLTGTVNPDEIVPEYLSRLEEAGSNVVMEEVQRQYSAWLASN